MKHVWKIYCGRVTAWDECRVQVWKKRDNIGRHRMSDRHRTHGETLFRNAKMIWYFCREYRINFIPSRFRAINQNCSNSPSPRYSICHSRYTNMKNFDIIVFSLRSCILFISAISLPVLSATRCSEFEIFDLVSKKCKSVNWCE